MSKTIDLSAATARPWQVDYDNDVGPNDDYMLQWFWAGPAKVEFSRDQGQAEANAELIVHAVNGWDNIEALEERIRELRARPEGPIRAAAREILKVNSYDAMREALEQVVNAIQDIRNLKLETYWDEEHEGDGYALIFERAQSALKLAKGE